MSYLWAINCFGKVFVLSTAGELWQELQYQNIEFKRISSCEFFTWGIGGDHQIYIYVPSRDVPIRCCVVTYENERWSPIHGFSSRLLPTDRPQWSSSDGLTALPQDGFHLPSSSWQWEEEWHIEDNLEGQPLEPEGWMYAIDFPARYVPNKMWNSLVRRRRWIRYRRYCCMNEWSVIPSIFKDPVQEPFIDVAVGGTDIPGGDQDKFSVWAVTIMGRVVFRYGVSTGCPEGQGWVPVVTPTKCEVHQVAVGPTGLVWAVTWEGIALVRFGVTRENAMGKSWIEVEPPTDEEKLLQVSIGTNVVWAISRSRKVWFRKGIKGLDAGINEASAKGSGWVEMVGEMIMISVGLNDQVFGIGTNGHSLFLRTGVTHSDLCGKTWKSLSASISNQHRKSSLSSLESCFSSSAYSRALEISDNVLMTSANEYSGSIHTDHVKSSPQFQRLVRYKNTCDFSTGESTEKDSGRETPDAAISYSCSTPGMFETNVKELSEVSWDNKSLSSIGESSVMSEVPSGIWSTALNEQNNTLEEHSWVWINSGGCTVDPDSLPFWFSTGHSIYKSSLDDPWYCDLLSKFKERYRQEVQKFTSYAFAIEKSTWVKTGTCQWFKNQRWISCLLELEQGTELEAEKGILTFYHKTERLVIKLSDITCVVRLLDKHKLILTIHTEKYTRKGKPIRLSFNSDEDLEDWLASLDNILHTTNRISYVPETYALWSTTSSGDVYVHSPPNEEDFNVPSKMLWNLLGGGHLRIAETCPAGVVWGIGYNCTAWVYTKGYGGGAYKGISGCNFLVSPMSDVRCLYIYENQRWNPLSGFSTRGLPTDRYMWSDQSGRLECTKENTHLPSSHWQWISDWCIDYKTPGGVDNEGWQYATDFPRSYHYYKSFTDYVRRRRWYRKCRLTTSGPWKKLGTTPLLDVSLQIDCAAEGDKIAVWAVATNGDVFSRIGVTASSPMGTEWIHVPAEKTFRSISVGGDFAVWAVANDGSVQLRNGINSICPTGVYWSHVEPPQTGCPVVQISAGKTIVLVVDENNRLWSREEIVPIYKEGTHWKMISENVKQISVGPMDQIWAVMESFETPAGLTSGVVCYRSGISEENRLGTEWKQNIGAGWNYVCVRSCRYNVS